jgi:hypothetical protein
LQGVIETPRAIVFRKRYFVPSFKQLIKPLTYILPNTPRLYSRGNRPLQMNFEDAVTLLRVLSNQRLTLLSILFRSGPSSIRALSKTLHRNYKNVHSDVTLLRKAGLIRLDHQDRVFVPWQKIYTEIDLMAAA